MTRYHLQILTLFIVSGMHIFLRHFKSYLNHLVVILNAVSAATKEPEKSKK